MFCSKFQRKNTVFRDVVAYVARAIGLKLLVSYKSEYQFCPSAIVVGQLGIRTVLVCLLIGTSIINSLCGPCG